MPKCMQVQTSHTSAQVDELMRRLDAAELIATQKFNDYANITYRAEVGGHGCGPSCACGCASATESSENRHSCTNGLAVA
jgi:hypothetical protein